ncbi:hypothetical protein PR202_gb17622 [Eleusine coracana subsp. coracana]|uniref:At1g61320/AtMIF1 LRR domain-containing protein n=1 Tax=Eleusine coracana subsp. coracana TaxID=191504 RepID=A0AAV5F142_ELECO|nr:hypothetical protein PR202_gb17622 [Eleusine coracana subsp. coracana]
MAPAAGSAEGSYDNVDPAQVLGALKRFSGVLSRLACALVSAGDIFGTDGSSRPGAPCNPEGLGEISFGESAGLDLACHVLHSRGRLLLRVGVQLVIHHGENSGLKEEHEPESVVEDLGIKFEFDNILVGPLNDWIGFAVSSHTKNLALDLAPAEFRGYKDRYVFPFELFDNASRSRIQHIKLSCVSLKLHSGFKGFPNLKKLDLHLFDTQRNNIDDMLSCCPNLEWLSLMRCRMKDELKVKQQLARLVYLRIAYCSITKADLHAKNLRTFVFRGIQLPIDLGQVKLQTAELHLYNATLEYILTVLPKSLCGVQNLTLNTYLPLEMPSFLKNICSFSQLKILQLFLFIDPDGTDNILSLGSFLRAAPLIEKLEMHLLLS